MVSVVLCAKCHVVLTIDNDFVMFATIQLERKLFVLYDQNKCSLLPFGEIWSTRINIKFRHSHKFKMTLVVNVETFAD